MNFFKLTITKERPDHFLCDLHRLGDQAMIAENFHKAIGVEGGQLMVVSYEQASSGEHQRAHQLRSNRLGCLFDNDPVELLARLHESLHIG